MKTDKRRKSASKPKCPQMRNIAFPMQWLFKMTNPEPPPAAA